MTDRTYPYQAWILMPSFKPVEVTMVSAYKAFHGADYGDRTEAGKLVPRADIFASAWEACKVGNDRLIKQQIDLDKKQANINKRAAEIKKALKSLTLPPSV